MTFSINRRAFTLGSAGLALSLALPGIVRAQSTKRSVTTSLGTYEIPADPQRVVCIDSRIDLQPAMAIGLNIVGYAHSVPGPWVHADPAWTFFGSPPNIEQVLAVDPDLIICADYDPASEWWPLDKLRELAPVLPTNGDKPWRAALKEMADWTGKTGAGDAAIAEYDALIADIRERHADKLATRAIVSVQPDQGQVWLMNGSTNLQTQVLPDLGAKTIPPAEGQKYDGGAVSSENFLEKFGAIDGFILATSSEGDAAGLTNEPIWQRLPAVKAGVVISSNGNINYGSIYSAVQVAKFIDELYGKMA